MTWDYLSLYSDVFPLLVRERAHMTRSVFTALEALETSTILILQFSLEVSEKSTAVFSKA